MKNPYEVLGVPENASDADIKKAYRELAKKYHPDNYRDNPLSDLANERMKEINEAYDTIQKQRASSSYGSTGSGYSGSGRSDLVRIRELVNSGRFPEAQSIADAVPVNMRNAEWHFLKGKIYMGTGRVNAAIGEFSTAYSMEPGNPEYASMYNQFRTGQSNFGGYRTNSSGGDCSFCDICTGLYCADCLCECCGGDLIRCC